MARTRQRHRIMHRRLQSAAALGMVAGLLATAQPAAAAGASGAIRLSGYVPPHASVRLSNWTISRALRSGTERLRLGVANLSILANNRSFTVSLASARSGGRFGLVEASTGTEIPYELTYGGVGLKAVDGEIPITRTLQDAAAAQAPKDIEVRLRPGTRLGSGRYQERLVLVIKAR